MSAAPSIPAGHRTADRMPEPYADVLAYSTETETWAVAYFDPEPWEDGGEGGRLRANDRSLTGDCFDRWWPLPELT